MNTTAVPVTDLTEHAPDRPGQARAALIRRQVDALLTELEHHDPHTQLTTLADLRATLDQTLTHTLVAAMAHARQEGWGLRRIATASHCSHEQVRTLLAQHAHQPAPPPPTRLSGP
ncbi:hypothetical protein ACK8N7_31910 [Streptomyces griseobrunneus]|uniref:hypothetical protein n=1 Tax=Streptomyces microflavus TaxID=1919 RepID=UPI0037F8FC90